MIRFKVIPEILIHGDREIGMFGFSGKGAIGKSYLFKVLDRIRSDGNSHILTITYDRSLSEEDIILRICNFDKGIIILDRFDLYVSDKILSTLLKKRNSCLILFDLKNWEKIVSIDEDGVAIVDLRSDCIEVELHESCF